MGKGSRLKRERQQRRAEMIQRRSTEPHAVVMKCPVTDKWVPTGLSMDAGSFDSSTMANNSSACDACGQDHRWGDAEVALQN